MSVYLVALVRIVVARHDALGAVDFGPGQVDLAVLDEELHEVDHVVAVHLEVHADLVLQ